MQGSRKAEPYFCDRTLLQSLVRDAMVTDGLDRNTTGTSSGKEDKQYALFLNVSKVFFIHIYTLAKGLLIRINI